MRQNLKTVNAVRQPKFSGSYLRVSDSSQLIRDETQTIIVCDLKLSIFYTNLNAI